MTSRSPFHMCIRPVLAALAIAAGATLAAPVGAPTALLAMGPASVCTTPLLLASGESSAARATNQDEADCECTDINGEPRQCTWWEEFQCCRDAAWDMYEQCRADGGGYLECMIPRDLSLFVCDLLAVRPW